MASCPTLVRPDAMCCACPQSEIAAEDASGFLSPSSRILRDARVHAYCMPRIIQVSPRVHKIACSPHSYTRSPRKSRAAFLRWKRFARASRHRVADSRGIRRARVSVAYVAIGADSRTRSVAVAIGRADSAGARRRRVARRGNALFAEPECAGRVGADAAQVHICRSSIR